MPDHTRKARRSKSTTKSEPTKTQNDMNSESASYELQDMGELSTGQVIQLQRIMGNAATIRLLDKRQPNRIQRCTGRPGCQCPKCRAKRAGLEIEQHPSDGVIHRAPASTKVLTAPELAGNARLQAAIGGDKSKFLRFGQVNDGVEAVQKALIHLNYPLPKHGADSIYGSETGKAIKAFQDENRESADGIVGPKTLAKLNSALLSPKPPTPGTPGMTAGDKEITGVFGNASSSRNQIFFDKGSASLTDDPTALSPGTTPGKIRLIAKDPLPIGKQFTVTGLRSEDEPDALANLRTEAVVAELNKELAADPSIIAFGITKVPNPSAGDGNLDYRRARVVAISETGASSPIPECKQIPCPNKLQLTGDFALAQAKIDATIAKLADPTTDALLQKYFNTTLTNKADTIGIITRNLTKLKVQLATHLQNETPAPQPGLQCGTDCFEVCTTAAAFVIDVGASARMVLCPSYFSTSDANERAEMLLHEGTHSVEWETTGGDIEPGTDDHAASFARLNTQLETPFALVNADSYVMFISELLSAPGTFDPNVAEDKYDKGVTAKKEAETAIAYLESYLITASTSVDAAYSGIEGAQKAGVWPNSFARIAFALLARRFQLTLPPASPTNDDQVAVAAIFDRVDPMASRIRGDINIKQDAALATTEWQTSSGLSLTLGADFLAASNDRARVEILLLSFVKATPGISSNVQEQYAGLVGDMRRQRSLAEAPVS